VAKRVIELHGGSIVARSPGSGEGAEFVVSLPVSTQSAASDVEPVRNDGQQRSLHVLLVDDNNDAADSLHRLLVAFDFDATVANDGEQAQTLIAKSVFDVVLTDLNLPRLDGFEIGRCVRRQPWGSRCLLAAITGRGQREDRALTEDVGFDHHLVKPVDPQKLLELIARWSAERDSGSSRAS